MFAARVADDWKSVALRIPVGVPKPPLAAMIVGRGPPVFERRMNGRRSTSGSTWRWSRNRLVSWYASSANSDSSSWITDCSIRHASKLSGALSQALVTMRASTCGRRMSLVSSSSRFSSMFMRERRSVNSHDARSIIASARRELRISCSIVSSSTRLRLPPARPAATCAGSSPRRVCGTVPVFSAARSIEIIPCSQIGNAGCSVGSNSRRFSATAGSATVAASSFAPWSIPWTTTGMPPSSRST